MGNITDLHTKTAEKGFRKATPRVALSITSEPSLSAADSSAVPFPHVPRGDSRHDEIYVAIRQTRPAGRAESATHFQFIWNLENPSLLSYRGWKFPRVIRRRMPGPCEPFLFLSDCDR
jgi:hypothetical protein